MAKNHSTRCVSRVPRSELGLTDEDITRIPAALVIGLASFGEIERLSDAQEIRAMRGKPVKKDLRVIHPTGASGTVTRFADALWLLG